MSGDWFSVCVEVFGYIASLVVVFSLTRTSVKKLWLINAVGCFGFIIFAMITKSYPTALMNLGALIIDLVQLYRLGKVQNSFELVPASVDSEFFNWFVNKHIQGIKALDEQKKYLDAEKLYYFVRNNDVAGLFAYNKNGHEAEIVLDYVTPKYRDCKIGQYFFGMDNPYTLREGISSFVTYTDNPNHDSYLSAIGFKKEKEGKWVKSFDRE